MADFNLGNQFGGQNTEEPPQPQVPTPPSSEVSVRTMQSDAESFKASGGMEPSPDIVKFPSSGGAGGANGLDQANAGGESNFSAVAPSMEKEKGGAGRAILIILAIVVLAGAFAALGYYVVFPMLYPPVAKVPQNPVIPLPQPQPAPQPQAPTHSSLLVVPADETKGVALNSVDLPSIRGIFSGDNVSKLPNGSIRELAITGPGGTLAGSGPYLSSVLSDLKSDDISANLQEDFTSLLYFDENGVWPVFVGKIKDGAILANAQIALTKLESSAQLANLFIQDPGKSTAAFKNGSLNGKLTRYKVFSQKGAAINYGWFGDYFVLGTSYNGFKEAVRRIGF